MKLRLKNSFQKSLAQLLFIGLPTCILMFALLRQVNFALAILENNWFREGVYFLFGMAGAIFFYSYRFRFLTTALILYFLGNAVFYALNHTDLGEFSAFWLSIKFYLFGGLFFFGWFVGVGLSRWRLFTILWSIGVFVGFIIVMTQHQPIRISQFTSAFWLTLFYSVYIIFVSEYLRNLEGNVLTNRLFLRKTALFTLVLIGFIVLLGLLFKSNFETVGKDLASGQFNGKNNSSNMTKKNKDGSLSNNDKLNLSGSLNKNKNLVFVAHLNNTLPGSEAPNPLYFTSLYYNKYDTASQSFLIDSLAPSNDLFQPDPSQIPLYFSKVDSTAIRNSKATLDRKVVSTEVYKVDLAPSDFVAPSTAFMVQPIAVPKDYKDKFKSAYRAQMWVSNLNSAYFVYNPAGDMAMESFQKSRYSILRTANDYSKESSEFMHYYTAVPKGEQFDKIRQLASEIAGNDSTTMDKMLSIRDYFLQKDAAGKNLFAYSDNPGVPGIPSASKLTYFLFQNRKGYCAYFAGATLFLLRSLGVPSRIAAGFLTVDRSSKNPGWYWFYEDQAHAWVQVYFPGYGWMDFDTTIPDVNTQQAPQPDGTPPLGNLQTYFVGDGTISEISKADKSVVLQLKNFMIQDKSFDAKPEVDIRLDAKVANVSTDTGTVNFDALKKGMHITAASSDPSLKNIQATPTDEPNSLLQTIPTPTPVTEIKIVSQENKANMKNENADNDGKVHFSSWLITVFWILVVVIIVLTVTPWVIFQVLVKKAKTSTYYVHRSIQFYLNQLSIEYDSESPEKYSREIDRHFGTDLEKFSNIYQKYKYSQQPLSQEELAFSNQILNKFRKKINQQISWKTRVSKFVMISPVFDFFANK
ncbi:transglutaminase domain-containing protein [Rhizosphaericola mali]|nr:transglutaminase domain-containing protein [Rhizosphaericola mali]